MRSEIRVPLRPKGQRFRFEKNEMDCLVWYVLSACKREEAYMIFVRPDLKLNPKYLTKEANQFFASVDARNFIRAYRDTLLGANSNEEAESDEEDDREKRAGKAVQKFTDRVVEKMSGDIDSIDEMDAIAKLADRVGVLAEKEEVIEKPRRYLPETCGACRYKQFVEEHIKTGDIIDE